MLWYRGMVSRQGSGETPQADSFLRHLIEAAERVGRPLSQDEAGSLASHYRLLREWSRRMNLTGLKGEEAILNRHFLEPLAASHLFDRTGTLVDLGSGNGFPAIPLAVLQRGIRLILVESSEKKSAFLWAVLREVGLRGSRVETRRVRHLGDLADLLPCTYLTARAIRIRELFKAGEGIRILEKGGKAVFFVAREEAMALQEEPPPGLKWRETGLLPTGSRACFVEFETSDPP